MDSLCGCNKKSPSLQHHLYCSSAGARVWVAWSPHSVTFISMGSERYLCLKKLLVKLNIIAAPAAPVVQLVTSKPSDVGT